MASRTVTIVTPENICVTYPLAGIASRFLATLVDLILQLLLVIAVTAAMRLITSTLVTSITNAVGAILVYVIIMGYAMLFEAFWSGRTPGKHLFGLRVMRDGGYPITFTASAVRNFLRVVDYGLIPLSGTPLLLCGLPGLITIFLSSDYKRIGDHAAGTIVVVERAGSPFGVTPRGENTATAFLKPYIRNIDRLTQEEYSLIRRFTARRHELELPVQAGLAERIARPLMEKLDIRAPILYQLQYAELLAAIEQTYALEHQIL